MTILLLARSSLRFAQVSVESIRNFGGISNISVILVENEPVEGLREWARTQQDISFVYMDEGAEPWGKCLNEVLDAFGVNGYVLVMQSGMLLTKECIANMISTMKESTIGAVGCVQNRSLSGHQLPDRVIEKYEDALEYTKKHTGESARIVLGLDHGLFLSHTDILKEIGGFHEQIYTMHVLVKDFALRLLGKGYRSLVCRGAFAFVVNGQPDERLELLKHYAGDLETLEFAQGMHYFNMQGNLQMLSLIEQGREESFAVWEIGCDCGATLHDVKLFYPLAHTVGCDINARAVEIAACFVDEAFIANIEQEEIKLAENSMDYIISGDVLEHLHDPENTLRYVGHFLRDGGRVLANIPNVMHVSVMRQLLHGDFTYTETGLLDHTHIHLFTYNEIIRMSERAGYVVETIEPSYSCEQEDPLIDRLLELDPAAKRFMYEAFQYKVRAKRTN